MSRRSPRPPGLPTKPTDTYRPGARSNDDNRHNPSVYSFRGANERNHDDYGSRRSPPRHHSSSGSRYDSYAPGQDRENFSFRYDAPPSVDFRQADTWPSRGPPPSMHHRSTGRSPPPRSRRNANRQRGGYRGRAGPRLPSERAFLKSTRAATPELMLGMDVNGARGVKFRPVEDVSDSEETDMDVSDDSGIEDDQPKKKVARIEPKAADGDSVPRWSNPDPYTALPPPDETTRKKKDVVKLIRKARIEVSSANNTKSEAAQDDFISFDTEDDEDSEHEETTTGLGQSGNGVPGAPSGPRASNSKPPVPAEGSNFQIRGQADLLPSKPLDAMDIDQVSKESSRKRTMEDQVKETPTISQALSKKRTASGALKNPPRVHDTIKGKPKPAGGSITPKWRAKAGIPSTPWILIDHSDTVYMGVWLHKEIVDFYHYVKPRNFEGFIRSKLIEDLRITIQKQWNDIDILSFGSFPAGLYLPTADMDLVCVSKGFLQRGIPRYGQTNSDIRRFARFIELEKLAVDGTIDFILGAKVPLVKYVDRITGLKVDISFENMTGITANQTFQEWKVTFPAMPIIVTLIKHFLAMRGLNEPVNGGIGGFSVTCLVVSLLQSLPAVQSGNMVPEHHLGEILMEFLDLFGNEFDPGSTAIQFDPPGFISKTRLRQINYRDIRAKKFSIIDPNNDGNDISGGSSNTQAIRDAFSKAYTALQRCMGSLQFSNRRPKSSILGCILEGNYESFKLQRDHLAHVHEQLYGAISADGYD